MSSRSSVSPSRASLARALVEARQRQQSRHASSAQLQRYLLRWFPRGLWSFIYRASPRGGQGVAAKANVYRRFCRDPPRVSHEWTAALQLVELACLVGTMPGTSLSKGHHKAGLPTSTPTPEPDSVVQATEHLLRYGVFPPAGWALTLQLLHKWRERQPRTRLQVFPTSLSPPAAAQLLHHISLAPPSQQAWQDALCLYHLCAAEVHTPFSNGRPLSTKTVASPSPPRSAADTAAHSAFLKALRHMTLTTFLQANEWERGLHFYYHTLYQRDLPGPITTSYLVQQLGRAGQWAAVLQVYELCVKLLHAQRHQREQQQRLPPHGDDWSSRQWGTTLSMAMAAAQNSPGAPASTLAAMMRQLQPGIGTTSTLSTDVTGAASSSSPPLVRLSGHFLSALQALPSEKDRLAVLGLARRGSLLDIFKLIRGLISKHKWEEALLLFEEAMRSTPARTPSPDPRGGGAPGPHTSAEPTIRKPLALSRREIGEARLSFLHEATIDSVTAVVAALNGHRSATGKRSAGAQREGEGAHHSPSAAEVNSMRLMLNDREVECVLSKTLALREAEHRVLSPAALGTREHFWRYCLELLAFNYGALPCGDASAKVSRLPEQANEGHSAPPRSPRRTPTLAALSFLLRHPQLPWHVALRLLRHYGVLETCPDERAAASTCATGRRAASPSSVVQRTRSSSPPTPHSLALAAAVELLRTQGQLQAAETLALESLDREVAEKSLGAGAVVSLSAALLEVAQYPALRSVLLEREEERLTVEGSTLFHLLHESTRVRRTQAEDHGDDGVHGTSCETANSSAPPWWAGSAAFFHHPSGRALTVVWLLMQRRMRPHMTTTDAARQDGSASLLASLFLCVPPPPTASVAAASLTAPLHSWLLAYPVGVHCEVVRVIKCLTSPSSPSMPSTSSSPEADLCYTKRWVWMRRYLASLAAHFSAPCTDTRARSEEESFAENEPGHAAADAVAREAYYGATFEAVVSLLDAAVPRTPDSRDRVRQRMQMDAFAAATVAEQDEAAPRSSAQRVQQLHQLLERAIIRYGCLPPTHMLLPNQMDRLLPPLPRSSLPSADMSVRERRSRHGCVDRDGACAERCAVALHLVRLVLGALKDAGAHHSVEPVLLHNLLKLCCRVAEYEQAFLTVAKGTIGSDIDSSAEVSRAGAMLVRLQCELCGLQTVRQGTLSLLYHLCAAAQSCASSYGHTVPRQVALETTRYLLEAQTAAAARKDPRRQRQEGALSSATSASTASSSRLQKGQQRLDPLSPCCAVQARHCRLFFSLLGWEEALEVWYGAFPHEVLTQLSRNPQAVEACLSLGERSQL
ncbi:conserved hypothetical protein [Leishmania major strain Friedlin]|uniref:Uncharacterized protein n=1 Tax=Leishmania major TaxID=5664 RepID=Q4Q5Z2_LEIMA|nr:conserved hypothetical protein [Leishmania major strain Friedlin]CAG9579450.1 hypothetical_protein_-_conserved [Leishmania major strain Friedlin]CAJ08488.1 conserved hypothetical protein [Leishmania major strain Friedlin]|eukprot:XP_001685256.1 conserved hypothetical protein [Leishmania major strain Friedlin]